MAREWIAARGTASVATRRLARFVRRVRKDAPIADLGSGPGWYAEDMRGMGISSVALDLTHEMLAEAGRRYADLPRVRADLSALPFARRSLGGAWAINSFSHLPAAELPTALAHVHHTLAVDAPLEFTLADLEAIGSTAAERRRGAAQRRFDDRRFPGRLFTAASGDHLRSLLQGAGFEQIRIDHPEERPFWHWVTARCAFTLPDFVGPDLDLLVCGLNPSLAAAETGIPFVGPSNRFWPAARKAGLVERERDPWHALRRGLGFTDLAKRATRSASELRSQEYATGLKRLESLVRRQRPRAICLVGLDGWRRAVDPKVAPGWLEHGLAGRPAYLMPSTSGRNTHADLAGLVRHLRRAARGPAG
ncbi:MAG: uracil-DNA glycosylase family protein [Myxococcota bacterium]